MSSNTLSGSGVSPATTKAQILHIGTGTPGVATVRTGDGTATVLEFVSGGTKINGTHETTGNAVVGGNAIVSGNQSIGGTLVVGGQVTALGVPVFKRLTSDVTATTTTNVALTALNFTPVIGAVYQVELILIAQSVATTTGVKITNIGGTGTLVLADPAGSYAVAGYPSYSIPAIGGTYSPINAPVANAPFGIRLEGVFVADSAADLAFAVLSEVAASAVTIKANSLLKITRIS